MNNLTEYYGQIKEVRAEIKEPYVHVMSLANPKRGWKAGSVAEVTREVASGLIVDGSHRLATPTEVKAFQEESHNRRREMQRTESRKLAAIINAGRLLEEDAEAPKANTDAKADSKATNK